MSDAAKYRPVRILVTGFGPFPGAARNVTSALIETLLASAPRPGINLRGAVLPVDWEEGPRLSRELIAGTRPDAILHFGISRRATGFVIETCAYNECSERRDASGRTARQRKLIGSALPVLHSTLPCRELVSALRRHGLPATLSRDPGRYLCNATLFGSLANGPAMSGAPLAAFIHVPAFSVPESSTPRIAETDLVSGAEILIRAASRAVLVQRPVETRGVGYGAA